AGEAKQPPADGDQRQSRDAELPLIEAREDADRLSYRVGKTMDRGKQPPIPPTTLVASRMVRSRLVLSFSIACGWTVSPSKFYQDHEGGATQPFINEYGNIICYYRYNVLSIEVVTCGAPVKREDAIFVRQPG